MDALDPGKVCFSGSVDGRGLGDSLGRCVNSKLTCVFYQVYARFRIGTLTVSSEACSVVPSAGAGFMGETGETGGDIWTVPEHDRWR